MASAAEQNLALLEGELKNIGLPSYQKYQHKFTRCGLFDDNGYVTIGGLYEGDAYDVKRFMSIYLARGYPSLGEVVSFIAPLIRRQLLVDNGCWIKSDPRCNKYVEDSSAIFDIESIKSLVEKERSERQALLEKELSKLGMPDDYRRALLKKITNKFVNDGIGQADCIAYYQATLMRHEELKTAFRVCGIKFTVRIDQIAYLWCINIRETQSMETMKEKIRVLLKSCSKKIVTFILGDSKELGSAEIVLQIQAEIASRQELVNKVTSEFDIDLNLKTCYANIQLTKKIEVFVEEGNGDASQICATFFLEKCLKEQDLPARESFIRNVPSFNEQFQGACLHVSRLTIQALANELVDAQKVRVGELFSSLAKANCAEYGDSDGFVSDKQSHELHSSDYARFGTGTVDLTLKSHQRIERERRLQKALSEAIPPLMSSSLRSRLKSDTWLVNFLEGDSIFADVTGVVSTLQAEEKARRSELEYMLVAEEMNPESFFEWLGTLYRAHGVVLYLSEGTGSCQELLSEAIKDMRKFQLKDKLMRQANSFHSHDVFDKHPDCLDFIEGRSKMTCDEIAELVVKGKVDRMQKINAILSNCISFTVINDIMQYKLKSSVHRYVESNDGDILWLEQAICYACEYKRTEDAFGDLKVMLPRIDNCKVKEWREEHSKIVKATMEEIIFVAQNGTRQEQHTRIDEGNGSQDSDLVTCLSEIILAFYGEPSYKDSVRYGQFFMAKELVDHRIILMLTCPVQCPWNNALAAVSALRSERQGRIDQYDESYGSLTKSFEPTPIRIFLDNATPEDKADRIWHEHGTRADYINGHITMKEASKIVVKDTEVGRRLARKTVVKNCLLSGGLHTALASKNQECLDFIKTDELCDPANKQLQRLISKLQDERKERCHLLTGCFSMLGIPDPGSGPFSYEDDQSIDSGESELYHNCDYDYYHDIDGDSFPERDDFAKKRFNYVDLGNSKPEKVVDIAIKLQRFQKLETAIATADLGFGCHVDDWIRRSRRCKTFISDTKAGYASYGTINTFLTMLRMGRVKESDNRTNESGVKDEDDEDDEHDSLEDDYDEYESLEDDYCDDGDDYGDDY